MFDADCVQINVGDTVYNKISGEEYTVFTKLDTTGWIGVQNKAEHYIEIYGNDVTHVMTDNLKRIKADLDKSACEYFGFDGKPCEGCPALDIDEHCTDIQNADIVNRLKALFEKDA